MNPDPRTLVVSDRADLLDVVMRAAAAAGVVPEVARDPHAALTDWARASLVLVGTDMVATLAQLVPPRRSDVYVVGTAAVPDELLGDVLACGAAGVLVLPGEESRLVGLFADAADGDAGPGTVVGVVGGAGGVGATTFAAALALTSSGSGPALIIDADRSGGGADHVLGIDGEGARWDVLTQAEGRLSSRSLHESLPRRGALSLLGWPADRGFDLTAATVRAAVGSGRRGYRTVVVDLPREPPAEILGRCDHVVVVTTATLPALAAATRTAHRLVGSAASVVLRGKRGVRTHDVEELLGLEVWHRMADQPHLDEAIGLGLGPLRSRRGPLARAARVVDRRLGGDVR